MRLTLSLIDLLDVRLPVELFSSAGPKDGLMNMVCLYKIFFSLLFLFERETISSTSFQDTISTPSNYPSILVVPPPPAQSQRLLHHPPAALTG